MKLYLLLIILLVVLGGCTQIDDRTFCLQDSDCATECGGAVGRGECINKDFAGFENHVKNNEEYPFSCMTEECAACYSCKCVDNVCVTELHDEHGCC